jgi:hypothetical protein
MDGISARKGGNLSVLVKKRVFWGKTGVFGEKTGGKAARALVRGGDESWMNHG